MNAFNNKIVEYGNYLQNEQRVIVSGKVSRRTEDEPPSLLVENVKTVDNSNIFTIKLLDEIKYFNNVNLRENLKRLIYQFMDYQSQLDFIANGAIEYHDNDMISNALFTLCQLKAYVNQLVKERGE